MRVTPALLGSKPYSCLDVLNLSLHEARRETDANPRRVMANAVSHTHDFVHHILFRLQGVLHWLGLLAVLLYPGEN
jgi:hypothetical protein